MINSVLNRHHDIVYFDNIKTADELITSPPQIKQHIQQHFEQWTSHRHVNSTLFNQYWADNYRPNNSINSEIYTSTLNTISSEEVYSTLQLLPNNKACGPTGISYEMLKHAGPTFLQVITNLFNQCLTQQRIPKQWKEGRIYPISKKPIFNGDLNNTRPISLIEHIKKLYTKILTNRLNTCLTKNPILSPYNYIALPGNSTSTPIHILNNLIEDSIHNKQEIWLLSQDMSKAYDSVNFELFQKSLERINFPPQLTNILMNLLTDRKNQVITNFGLTNPYSVHNGIDQGETITPLFWRIYYDPLINYISTVYSGYTTSTSWLTKLTYPKKYQSLTTSVSVLAYMDDTIWIAKSKLQLEQITQAASTFFQMANIQVNPQKSILITNNPNPSSITFSNYSIEPQLNSIPFKFLGCWFTLQSNHKSIIKIITQESSQLINTLSSKQITAKQAAYIINTVIIPTIEYRIQNIVLSHSVCNSILAKYLTVAKHKAKLSRSIPNSTMLNHNIYGIKNIWDIQLQHHTSNFLNRLNNSYLLGTTTHIRLQQLQNTLWSTINILQHSKPNITGPNKYSTTFQIILLFKHLQLSVQAHESYLWPKTVHDGHTPLELLINNHKQFLYFNSQLRNKQILYLEQLSTADNSTLLTWQHISPRINQLPKGKKPSWFKYLESKILVDTNSRLIQHNFRSTYNNNFSSTTGDYSKTCKPWLLTINNNNEIIIGKARKHNSSLHLTTITHWNLNIDPNITEYYPLVNIQGSPCLGCDKNSQNIKGQCTFNIPTNLAIKFLGRKEKNNSQLLNLNANYLDLVYSIAIRYPLSTPLILPSIPIDNSIIFKVFNSNFASLSLHKIAIANLNSPSLSFYTDGSVIGICSDQCSAGIGWVQVDSNNLIIQSYSAQIELWPSSFRSELLSILSATCTAPINCIIDIFTDSLSTISKFNSLSQLQFNSSKLFKTNYWPIWSTLLNIIKTRNLKVQLHKVKAHNNDLLNDEADRLAKNHQHLPNLSIIHNNEYNTSHTLQWQNYPIEQHTRRFVKNICNAHVIALWSSQKRTNEWTPFISDIDWNSTWLYLNNNSKRSNSTTSLKLNTAKAFRIKLLLNELPTLSQLHIHYPTLITTNQCTYCNQIDNTTHWMYCPNNTIISNIIKLVITETTQKLLSDISVSDKQLLASYLTNYLTPNNNYHEPYYLPYNLIIRGLIPTSLTTLITSLTLSKQLASQFLISLLLTINQNIFEQIWKPYCLHLQQWKKENNINIPRTPLQSKPKFKTITRKPKQTYTYSCICEQPDQLHSSDNTCPPTGIAIRKINIWSMNWIKYSVSTNYILNITI
jgi:ribonuclease HI